MEMVPVLDTSDAECEHPFCGERAVWVDLHATGSELFWYCGDHADDACYRAGVAMPS